ncbi:YSC84-related protein [Methylobacter sp. BlB1]|uniref:lipid-binding SYLF domain-containing protein n=1 Tax=Methylobacter sp. BlB1 TaxID=2785914 RepID=UPI001894965B|nr:lipid-binding SYLF domain-containing protein [Methylobacter sp. BlB1]MBF6649348.1 lipid-binding SYLF domain-containing protein [Methylobacter sp. BlB1]
MKPTLMLNLLLIFVLTLAGCESTGDKQADTTDAVQIDRDVDAALAKLYETAPSAKLLASKAKGILVFPNIVKAGFIGGAQYGKGALRKRGRTAGYYNIVAGSFGLQAGVQSFDYALFFMNDEALAYLDRSEGFELGIGPTVAVLDAGAAGNLSTTTLKDDVYAFIFGQRGLMAGINLEGSKITRVNP